MRTLIVTDGDGRVVGTLKVGSRPQTIGRSDGCALVLASRGVSRIHASVYLHGGAVVINDEGSANGVRIDGRLITGPTVIDAGSAIRISSFSLRLHDDEQESQPRPSEAVRRASAEQEDEVDFDTRLEVAGEANARASGSSLVLVGRGGPFDRARFELRKKLIAVGRDEDNDVVIEDPSVSRRHAQLRLSPVSDQVTVLDLRSANGTYVEGQRIKRAEAPRGASIQFGDVLFVLSGGTDLAALRGDEHGSHRRVWIAAVVLAVLLGAAGVVAYLGRRAPAQPTLSPAQLRAAQEKRRARVLIEEARRKLASHSWIAAIELLDRAFEIAPMDVTTRDLRRQAHRQLRAKDGYDRAMTLLAAGDRDSLRAARQVFKKVPSSSAYGRESRYKIRTIDEQLARYFRVDGISQCRAHYYRKCYDLLCKFFETLPADAVVTGELRLRRRMRIAERYSRHATDFRPCTARRYLAAPESGSEDQNPWEVLSERYPIAPLRRVVLLYFEGKVDEALTQLDRLKDQAAMRPSMDAIAELRVPLLVVSERYPEGLALVRERKVEAADRAWIQVLAADQSLIPTGIDSFYRLEVTRSLGRLYFELGEGQFEAGRYADAFASWRRGKEIYPGSEPIQHSLRQLGGVAKTLLRRGEELVRGGRIADARASFVTARDISEEGSATQQQAERALRDLGRDTN